MAREEESQIAAFSDLLEANRGRIFGYVYAMLHNMADAEDVYQQTTVLLWEKFGEFQAGSDFGAWALKVAYFNVKNFQRSQNRKRRFFSEAVMERVAESYTTTKESGATDRLEALVECVKRLPSRHRSLLKQRYGEGQQVKSLAQAAGKSEAALSMILTRVRKSLMECIRHKLAANS